MLTSPRNQRMAAVLAFAGLLPFAFTAIPMLPLLTAGHKIYLRQWRWALLYGSLSIVPIPAIAKMVWVASILEGIWYLMQDPEAFDLNFNQDVPADQLAMQTAVAGPINKVLNVTDAVRELDQLRQDGLISEYEFEQKRRRLIDRIG
ncbi:SHOCT domain-containing protein [filamentous cyanobacterium LEGE 11480]|uniref:SHOCT domain-containing protein n=1 Tax=Romeriopsis navalis LEGE 11480 TaxID=2777977 RepID=A0A928Z4Z1_9CYAN|nr:SHOCT domain-containing protein [Romeriopsis navalis]MBE9031517.1 SHOCT domain-containing protein [Romeriopsis navalis LEGE 11480]